MGIQYNSESVDSGAISVDWGVSQEGSWHQVFFHFSAAPTTRANIEVWLIHPDGGVYSIKLREFDPFGVEDVEITGPRTLVAKGFLIRVTYPNPDDLTIGVTIKGTDNIQQD